MKFQAHQRLPVAAEVGHPNLRTVIVEQKGVRQGLHDAQSVFSLFPPLPLFAPELLRVVHQTSQTSLFALQLLWIDRLVVIGDSHACHRLLRFYVNPGLPPLRDFLASAEHISRRAVIRGSNFVGNCSPNQFDRRRRIVSGTRLRTRGHGTQENPSEQNNREEGNEDPGKHPTNLRNYSTSSLSVTTAVQPSYTAELVRTTAACRTLNALRIVVAVAVFGVCLRILIRGASRHGFRCQKIPVLTGDRSYERTRQWVGTNRQVGVRQGRTFRQRRSICGWSGRGQHRAQSQQLDGGPQRPGQSQC